MSDRKFERKEYTPMRKAISNAMKSSLSNGAQLTLGATFDASAILAVRKEIKEKHEELAIANASVNDIVMYVVSRAIKNNTTLNGIIGEDYFDQYEDAHIAFAVDTERGLLTPVIFDASEKTLSEIANESKELIGKANEGKLRLNEMQGGSFTISNLGLSGVQFFTPVINPPQAAILGIGSPIKRVKLVDGQAVEYPEITLSLTMDHGPNDGVAGANFLKELVAALSTVDNSILK